MRTTMKVDESIYELLKNTKPDDFESLMEYSRIVIILGVRDVAKMIRERTGSDKAEKVLRPYLEKEKSGHPDYFKKSEEGHEEKTEGKSSKGKGEQVVSFLTEHGIEEVTLAKEGTILGYLDRERLRMRQELEALHRIYGDDKDEKRE